MNRFRENWIDAVKIFAGILVAVGHLFQSLLSCGIIPGTGLYHWFNQTIYYFHVQLFFICSGYLYQRGKPVNSIASWKGNVLKKLVTLGVPYFTFSMITWILKTGFAEAVNHEVNSMTYDLFVHPMSPYWYLYTLFFVFLLTPTFSSKRMALAGVGISCLLKCVSIFAGDTIVYAVAKVLENEIWFVIGMCICYFNVPSKICAQKNIKAIGWIMAAIFIAGSILVSYFNIEFKGLAVLMGLLACGAVLVIAIDSFRDNKPSALLNRLSNYTMPIFLMHTIFAAGLRSILLRVGIESPAIHIVCGLLISFAGPIATAEIMKRFKWMEFFLYPGKFIKIGKKQGETKDA